jgi:hypothetical protein
MSKTILFAVREMYLEKYSSISLGNKRGNGYFRVVNNFAIKADVPSIKVKFHPFMPCKAQREIRSIALAFI